MLEQAIKDLVPSRVRVFLRPIVRKPTYHFYRWDTDPITGSSILRYWFWNSDHSRKNRKRLFIAELETLLKNTVGDGVITRRDFEEHCPRSNREGGAFAVTVGILVALAIVDHTDRRGVYRITDLDKVRRLLACH